MKQTLFLLLMGLFALSTLHAQKSENEKAVKQTIKDFAAFGDQQDADGLNQVLDETYRVVMNQLFGSKEVFTVNKQGYLEKIRAKEWGGDKRSLTFHNVHVNGKSASAEVTMKGTKMSMRSFLTLIQDAEGTWKLVADIPTVL
ncbi:MAG: nuclear transport factor 2 family protein [Bacteroidota bacterium]